MKAEIYKYNLACALFVFLTVFLGLGQCTSLFAQHPNQSIRSGNEAYQSKNYNKAKAEYQKALKKNPKSEKAQFNAADADYMNGKFEEAADQFKRIAETSKDKKMKASSLHNLGNSLLSQKKYPESAKAFSDALKLNPGDEQSRYNLAYAKAMMRKQEQEKNKQNNKDKNKEKNKDQDKDKQQQNKEDKDQEKNKSEDDQKSSSGKKEEKKQDLTKEDAERLLKAMNKQEKDLHKKLQKKKGAAKAKVNIEKDW